MLLPLYEGIPPHKRPISETPLRAWMEAQGITAYAISKGLGCDPKSIRLLANGQVSPTYLMAFKLEEWTKGGVPAVSWLGTDLMRMMWKNFGMDWEGWRPKADEYRRIADRKRRR